MPAEIFVRDVIAIAVQNAEGTFEIPQAPAPAGFTPEGQAIRHPFQHDRMRRAIVRAPFAYVNADAACFQLFPRVDLGVKDS